MIGLVRHDVLRRRYAGNRPGLDLIDIVDAAIPVSHIRIEVLAQRIKPLPALDEFILRIVNAKVTHLDDLASILGLDRDYVVSASANLLSEGSLRKVAPGQVDLTPHGKELARTHAAIQPSIETLPITFDQTLRDLDGHAANLLIDEGTANDAGLVLIPAGSKAAIGIKHLSVGRINELIRSGSKGPSKLRVINIRKVMTQRRYEYIPAQLLVYGDAETGEIALGVCIAGEMSESHNMQLARIGAAAKLGIQIAAPAPAPWLAPELEAQCMQLDEVELLQAATDLDAAPQGDGDHLQRSSVLSRTPVRSVSMDEHPVLLQEALTAATSRFLLISPWVRAAVVTTDFVSKVEGLLRSGVWVCIGHGIGSDDSGSDARALRRLQNLADRYPEFTFARLTNSHAKILIWDDTWISTSFNWLSFRGDPNRTYRMEEGVLVRIPEQVDLEWNHYSGIITSAVTPDQA